MERLLSLLEENARLTNSQLAIMLEKTEDEIANEIQRLEDEGIIKGFTTIIDKSKTKENYVEAIIELKVTPKRDYGFEEIARIVAEYSEVKSVYLMSGGYDLAVLVHGKDFKDIAMFVAKKLSLLDSVLSTATHFVLTKYKDQGVIICDDEKDERRVSFL